MSLFFACLSITFTIFDVYFTESTAKFRGFSLSVTVYSLVLMAGFEFNFRGDPRFWQMFSIVGAVAFCIGMFVEGAVDLDALVQQNLQNKEIWWLLGSVVSFLHSALFAWRTKREAKFMYREYKVKKEEEKMEEERRKVLSKKRTENLEGTHLTQTIETPHAVLVGNK